jgi:alpha-tubulin suppressor-like RCC1 family protein
MVLCTLMMTPVSAAITDTPPSAVYLCQDYAFMIDSSGSVWAWGSNNNGQLGDGTYIDRHIPTLLKNYADLFGGNLTGVSVLKGGTGYTVALKGDGTVLAAGANGAGQLGKPGRADPAVFSQVPNVSNVVHMDAGEAHVLALKNDGTVWSWGDNSYGQLGNNSSRYYWIGYKHCRGVFAENG